MASENSVCWMSAVDLAAAIRRRAVSPVEVMRAVIDRIERLNPKLNAFVTFVPERAMKAARAAERAVTARGARLPPLHGVPFSTKDLVATRGIRTTFGTRFYAEHVPAESAPMVERLEAAGAIQLGKTNTPVFGWIGATHNLLFGATRNPWDLERTPGGSSGGASAAVAAGLGPLAIGTDGGGSIRIPASCTGIVGLKPSHGLIPIAPWSAAWSLSHVGPMTRTVADAALALQVAAGPDPRDQFCLPALGGDYVKALRAGIKGLRVAWSADLGYAPVVDPEVQAVCERAARRFRDLGCRVEEMRPGWPSPMETWETLFAGSIAARMEPYLRQKREDVEPGLAALVDEALGWPPMRYVNAWFDRMAWYEHPRRLFAKYDLLLTPTIACPPFPVGLDHAPDIAGRRVRRYAWLPFTPPFNLTGQPAASVPCGFTKSGLPVGLQIVGRRFEDATVLRAAAAWERLAPWAAHRPPLG